MLPNQIEMKSVQYEKQGAIAYPLPAGYARLVYLNAQYSLVRRRVSKCKPCTYGCTHLPMFDSGALLWHALEYATSPYVGVRCTVSMHTLALCEISGSTPERLHPPCSGTIRHVAHRSLLEASSNGRTHSLPRNKIMGSSPMHLQTSVSPLHERL